MPDLTNTVRLHCVLRASTERVYRAFLDPDAMVKWLPPHGFTGTVQHMDARVGGATGCHSRTSVRATAILSAASMSNSRRMSG